MISAEKARFPVSLQCELLGVSRSGYYEWLARGPSDREIADELLTAKIREIHKRARGVYGARRVHAELRLGHDIKVSRKRVERLMRRAGISGLVTRKRGRTTVRVPGVRVADDLVRRGFRPAAPNVLWVADITYLSTWELFKTPSRARSSAGRWRVTCGPSSSPTRSKWASPAGALTPG